MRKSKRQPTNPSPLRSLEELISDYDRLTLVRALDSMKSSNLGWDILRAALMKEYLRTVAYQLDLSSKTGTQIEAAYQAGCAQTMFDVANSLINQYRELLEEKATVASEAVPDRE